MLDLPKGKFQRRDFRLDILRQASAYSAEGDLFASLGKHDIFMPTKTYPPMTLNDLATVVEHRTLLPSLGDEA